MLRSSLWFLLLVAPLLERSWGFANSAQNHHRHPVLRFVSAVAPPENTASSEEAGDDNDVNAHNDMVKRTLYEILGATPNATKGELRRKYVALARTTHPDALIGSNATVSYESRSVEFSDIAQAWRVLSNDKERLRYDRSLAAQDFQRSFEQAASSFSKTAGPQLQRVFDEFAVPFLRRTTATTFATVSAAVESTKKGSDLSAALSDAFRAAIRAGRIVDGMELSEKSSELERR
jgi:curved DNA-binding protein CbpA